MYYQVPIEYYMDTDHNEIDYNIAGHIDDFNQGEQ